MPLYSIVETVLHMFYEAILNKSVISYQLMRELINWVNMSMNIENSVRNCSTCLKFQQTQPMMLTLLHSCHS